MWSGCTFILIPQISQTLVIFKIRSIFTKKLQKFSDELKKIYLLEEEKKHGYSYNFGRKMLISQDKILFQIVKLEVCMRKKSEVY